MINRCAIAVSCLLLGLAGSACHAKSKLPVDPGLAGDTYGIGVSLGQSAELAQQVAAMPNAKLAVWIMTPDELATRAPYSERPPEKDLAVALHMPLPASTTGAPAETDSVGELRFYLAPAATSQVRLLGKPIAPLTPEDVSAWLGEPVDRTEGNDGRTHLTYYFAPQQRGKPGFKLVTSHDLDGSCFAFAVSYAAQLPQ